MTPQQYEKYIGDLFSQKGYTVTVTPLSNDWGIDAIAQKGNEKIAIQAKMYGNSSRCINRRVIMELYGAAAFQDCTKAVIATDGEVMSDAKQVADKLGIEILLISPHNRPVIITETERIEKIDKVKSSESIMTFDEAWEKYIFPLKGKTLYNSRGSNRITGVDWSGILDSPQTPLICREKNTPLSQPSAAPSSVLPSPTKYSISS